MAKTYKKKGSKLEITKQVVEEISIPDLQAKRDAIMQDIAHLEAVRADIDASIAKATELGVEE